MEGWGEGPHINIRLLLDFFSAKLRSHYADAGLGTVMPIINEGRTPVIDSTTGYTTNFERGFSLGQFGGIFYFATWNNRGADSTKQEISKGPWTKLESKLGRALPIGFWRLFSMWHRTPRLRSPPRFLDRLQRFLSFPRGMNCSSIGQRAALDLGFTQPRI